VFAEFDSNPLGAASIGQAHRARLHDGREVVVKVKFPSVERNFESDMNTITNFCRLAQPEHVSCAAQQ
jgi:predicted unusual protein kinase regulating ubiquinone biosynthesis (AarF/ABC1/UbiB family)